MSVQTQIDRINAEVTSQTSLISQIQTALEGKAAGGGGASVETLKGTFSITMKDPITYTCVYTTVVNGVPSMGTASASYKNPATVTAVRNTILYVAVRAYASSGATPLDAYMTAFSLDEDGFEIII